jgi:hypothetical protein
MSLKLRTQKKRADIKFSDGDRISGQFFIKPSTRGLPGSEMVIDLLNDERLYIPFEIAGDKISLLQKESIMMVTLAINEMPNDLPYLSQIFTRICLLSGDDLEGNIFIDLPKTHARLSDFLNLSNRFFYIEVDGQDFLINTKFVKMAMPG